MLIRRNEIGVQHVARTFAAALGLATTDAIVMGQGRAPLTVVCPISKIELEQERIECV